MSKLALGRIADIDKTPDLLEMEAIHRPSLARRLLHRGPWAIGAHRVSHWMWTHRLYLLAEAVTTVAAVLTGAEISPRATVGVKVGMPHPFGVVIGGNARVGDNCFILQCVTLGLRTARENGSLPHAFPQVGNWVTIGAGAVLLGGITVGDRATIGANAVVLQDVPPGATAVGAPARIIPEKSTPENYEAIPPIWRKA